MEYNLNLEFFAALILALLEESFIALNVVFIHHLLKSDILAVWDCASLAAILLAQVT